jgi:hypothetical protein
MMTRSQRNELSLTIGCNDIQGFDTWLQANGLVYDAADAQAQVDAINKAYYLEVCEDEEKDACKTKAGR